MNKKQWLAIAFICFFYVQTTISIQAYVKPDFALSSKAVLLYDNKTDTIVFAHNSEQKMYPASLTKLLTAVVVVENTSSYQDKITITSQMLSGLNAANASTAGYVSGETLTITQLLYGLFLPSGADSANALAIYTSGTIDTFVMMMNDTAQRIGMSKSHFMNPTGLDHENQYTTANDMRILLEYMLDHDVLKQVLSTDEYVYQTNKHPDGVTLYSSMLVGKDTESPYYSLLFTGGKTGYTGRAGRCLASFSSIDDKEYLLITLNAPFEGFSKPSRSFEDSRNIYQWAHDRFVHVTYAQANDMIDIVAIKESWTNKFDVIWPQLVTILVDRYASAEPMLETTLQNIYVAPLKKDEVLGIARLVYQGEIIYQTELRATETIKRSSLVAFWQTAITFAFQYRWFFGTFGLLVALLFGLRWFHIIKQRRKRIARQKRRQKQRRYTQDRKR